MAKKTAPKPVSRMEGAYYLIAGSFNGAVRPETHETPFEGKAVFMENLIAVQADADSKRNFERYRGLSICQDCGKMSGGGEFDHLGWNWGIQYMHAVEAHNVIPSDDFISFINNAAAEISK